MNKHFEDTTYYLKRAGETAKAGLAEELGAVERRLRELAGREQPPDPGRIEELRADLLELQQRAEGEGREAIATARERLGEYRVRREA
ncbi:DUF7553 family protein [Halorarius halobius]|uniref:DUF7553 family protein n=1 Tax=Halorarius halobius TaxID=2962671 RepID=UPI0020CEFF1E|nr:hypothetical protein [Halorarius halobius]